MAHHNKRPDPAAFPGVIPFFESAAFASRHNAGRPAHVALALCDRANPSAVFDTLRDAFVDERRLGDAPVCFVAPSDPARLIHFVDALALMPELVLAPPSIESSVPGAVGMMRQFGARWIAQVANTSDVELANSLSRAAGFRGAPALLASTAEGLGAAEHASSAIFGVSAALLGDEAVWRPIASHRCILAAFDEHHDTLFRGLVDAGTFSFASETIRGIMGINEIREPCG